MKNLCAIGLVLLLINFITCAPADVGKSVGNQKAQANAIPSKYHGDERNLDDFIEEELDENVPLDAFKVENKNVGEKVDDEIMDTAENIVFRPYFKYKKLSVEKKRFKKEGITPQQPVARPSPNEKTDSRQKIPPPPVLIYDNHSGYYYPSHAYRPHSAYRPYSVY